MRQWRVGSFSMSLVLILLGAGLLLEQFKGGPSAIALIINWWPLVLIFLGMEVLAAGILFRNEQVLLKYDFWSMLLVVLFFLFSLTSYSLSYTGIIPRLQEALNTREHPVTLPDEVILLKGIEKIVLSCPGENLQLRTTDGDQLRIFGQGMLYAPSGAEAAALAESVKTNSYIEGTTLYVQVNELPFRSDIFSSGAGQIDRTILVPADIALELQGSSRHYQSIKVILESLAAPWHLSVTGPVTVDLSGNLHLTVTGLTGGRGPDSFLGNAPWVLETVKEDTAAHPPAGTITLGDGTWPLYILAEGYIKANTR